MGFPQQRLASVRNRLGCRLAREPNDFEDRLGWLRRITILAGGSRGDTQPFVALGVALKRAGCHVRLTAHENFERFVEGFGLDVPSACRRRVPGCR